MADSGWRRGASDDDGGSDRHRNAASMHGVPRAATESWKGVQTLMPESNVGSVIEELYDREGDVYYVNFGTGEPSYCVEVDDEIVVEVGLYSKLPTGYRLLNTSQLRTERRPVSDIKE